MCPYALSAERHIRLKAADVVGHPPPRRPNLALVAHAEPAEQLDRSRALGIEGLPSLIGRESRPPEPRTVAAETEGDLGS
jgi:hypothetical protein